MRHEVEEAPYGRTASERKRKVIQLWRVWHEMDKMETVAIVLRDNGGKELERFAAGKMTSMVHISPPATLICTLANEVEPVRHLILHFGTSITFMLHSGFDRYDLLQPFLILRCHLLGPLALATPSLRFCAWASPASFIEKFPRILSDMADPFVSFDQQRATALRRHATIRRSRQI